jgi:cobalt/nickel transport system permease protein
MLSRGWTGRMPPLSQHRTSRGQWLAGLAPVCVAAVLATAGWMLS